MPDVLGPLRDLGDAPLAEREPIESLRARTARRRRRQRAVLAPVLVAALVGVGALTARTFDGDGAPRGVDTVDDPDATSTSGTASTSTTVASVGSAPNPLAGARRVTSGSSGIVVLDPAATPPAQRITDEPTEVAFGVGDGLVVAQLAHPDDGSGAIVAFQDGERAVLEPATSSAGDARFVRLLDVALLQGRPWALVSTSSGPDPERWEVRLSRFDVDGTDDVEHSDYGVVGGWEEGITGAHLLSDGDVVLLHSWIVGGDLERRSADGTVRWETPGLSDGDDRNRMMVVHDSTLLVVEQHAPQITVRRFDLATGEEREPTELTVAGAELGELSLLCEGGPWSAPGGILCARRAAGGPVLIDLSTGRATPIPDAAPEPQSAMTLWRDGPR